MPSAQKVKTWYNRLYAARGLHSMRPREAYPHLVDLLAPAPGSSLLDVSCGSGFLLEAAGTRGLAVFGVDISDEAVRLARRVAPKAGLAVSAGEQLAFRDGAFHTVTCLGSLEHFLDMDRGLEEIRRVAKPGGRCLIMVPNRRFAGWWLLGQTGTAQQDVQEQLLTLGEWRTLFARHGFTVLDVRPDLWHADKWRLRWGGGARALVVAALAALAWRLIPLTFQYQFVFLLRRNAS